MARDRNIQVDALKGFLIICVIIGHMFWHFGSSGGTWAPIALSNVVSFLNVYNFHMPLFLATSMFFIPRFSKSFVKKTVIAILVPYFIWFFRPSFIYTHFDDARKIWSNFGNFLLGNFRSIGWHLWFLPALFACKIIFTGWNTARQRAKNLPVFVGITAGLWLVVFYLTPVLGPLNCQGKIPFGMATAVWLIPYFWLMKWIFDHREALVPIAHPIWVVPLFYFSSRGIDFFDHPQQFCGPVETVNLAQYELPTHPLGFVCFVLTSACVLLFFLQLKKPTVLAWIGRYSFPIFLLHMMILGNTGPRVGAVAAKLAVVSESPTWGPPFFLGYYLATVALGVLYPIFFSKFIMKISKDFRHAGFVE